MNIIDSSLSSLSWLRPVPVSRPRSRTLSSSCRTTWASPISVVTAARSARPISTRWLRTACASRSSQHRAVLPDTRFLTGLYPHQAGVGHAMTDNGEQFPGYRGDKQFVPDDSRGTEAGRLSKLCGRQVARYAPRRRWAQTQLALQRDDRAIRRFTAAGYYDPSSLVHDNTMISPYADRNINRRPITTPTRPRSCGPFVGDHAKIIHEPFPVRRHRGTGHSRAAEGSRSIAAITTPVLEPFQARFEKAAKLGLIDRSNMAPSRGLGKIEDKKWEAAGWKSTPPWLTAWTRRWQARRGVETDRNSTTLILYCR